MDRGRSNQMIETHLNAIKRSTIKEIEESEAHIIDRCNKHSDIKEFVEYLTYELNSDIEKEWIDFADYKEPVSSQQIEQVWQQNRKALIGAQLVAMLYAFGYDLSGTETINKISNFIGNYFLDDSCFEVIDGAIVRSDGDAATQDPGVLIAAAERYMRDRVYTMFEHKNTILRRSV